MKLPADGNHRGDGKMIRSDAISTLEVELNSTDAAVRRQAVEQLAERFRSGEAKCAPESSDHNMHCHTCYSYNGYGYSPSYIAYLARKNGWFAAGIVDFDVLDALDEFLFAAEKLNVRASGGVESRAFIQELSGEEINSPGEPGIAYHLGLGFSVSDVPPSQQLFLLEMRRQAHRRTRGIAALVNEHLTPAELDFTADAVRLTPNANVTERHLCQAYREKAEQRFPAPEARAAFWADKLGTTPEKAASLINSPVELEAAIRSKTMKKGGVGYVAPRPESFPPIDRMNSFIAASGAIPTIAWLNGLSSGESDPDRLLDLHISKGAAMLNIVPDRNWNVSDPEKQKKLIEELDRIINACRKRNLPVVVGTEMNAPGQKLVDDFRHPALARHLELFLDGAALLSAHTLLGRLGRGYLSEWAKNSFSDTAEKNRFFSRFGRLVPPEKFHSIHAWPGAPEEMLALAGNR